MEKILLVVEKDKDILFGRVQYQDDLLVDSAENLEDLESNFKTLLLDFHDLKSEDIVFEVSYDNSVLSD